MSKQDAKSRIEDIRRATVERIIERMEQGGLRWKHYVTGGGLAWCPVNYATKRAFHGANRVHLAVSAIVNNYPSGEWLTFNQARKLGFFPKRGEKATPVEYYKRRRFWIDANGKWQFLKDGENAPEGHAEIVRMLPVRLFHEFNVAQLVDTEGNPFPVEQSAPVQDDELLCVADRLIDTSRCPIVESAQEVACYKPISDEIELPHRCVFESAESFIATLTHEMTHSTMKPLDREQKSPADKEAYAYEELVAELGSLFICSDLGVEDAELTGESFEQHAAYLQSWLGALKDDPAYLFDAASLADKACNYIIDRYAKQERLAA